MHYGAKFVAQHAPKIWQNGAKYRGPFTTDLIGLDTSWVKWREGRNIEYIVVLDVHRNWDGYGLWWCNGLLWDDR